MNKLAIGTLAETKAMEYLMSKGYSLLERNFRIREGEIDLVMQDGDCIVFVEVRSQASVKFVHPLEALSQGKILRLQKAAAVYISRQKYDSDYRFDFVVVIAEPEKVEHYPNFLE